MNSAQFLEFLVSLSIQATVLVGITDWLCRVSRWPQAQYKLWSYCHLLLLLLTGCGLLLPHLRVLTNPWQIMSPEALQQLVSVEQSLGQLALVIWATGILLSLIMLASEWITVARFLKSCRPATESEVKLVFNDQSSHLTSTFLQPNASIQLLISQRFNSPFCYQWHAPVLVMPEYLLSLPQDEITFIARHELSHLRSGHPLQLFIERLVMTLFWFHPAIWWASRQSMLAREYACDDAAISARYEVVGYLKTLLAVAERGFHKEPEGSALYFGSGSSMMALRGRRIMARFESTADWSPPDQRARWWPFHLMTAMAMITWSFWLPVDALASSRMPWSPWPGWSAAVLRTIDIPARDYEPYDRSTRLHELSLESSQPQASSRSPY